MPRFAQALVLAFLLAIPAPAQDLGRIRKTAEHLQRVSVLIETGGSHGTGVVVRRGEDYFVLGNWHVVEKARSTREECFPDGSRKVIVEYDKIKVVRLSIRQGRTVGRMESECDLVAYSDDDDGFDLAVLQVRDRAMFGELDSTLFYLEPEIPFVGMPLYHVGCLNGEEGFNSFTTGVVSQHGRMINRHVFDQVSITNFPGSSGGGVYLTDGRCIGLLTRRSGETFGYINPIREIMRWAQGERLCWIFDPDLPFPSRPEISRLLRETIPTRPTHLPSEPHSKAAPDAELLGKFLRLVK